MKLLSCLFLVALATIKVASFSVTPTNKVLSTARTTPGASPLAASSPSLTAMNMVKIKVDPNAKEERINPAVFKNGLYLGSIAFAVLLPLFFVIAASKRIEDYGKSRAEVEKGDTDGTANESISASQSITHTSR